MSGWVSFDVFGTLVDWDAGLLAALSGTAAGPRAAELIAAGLEAEWDVSERHPEWSYRQVLGTSLGTTARRLGIGLGDDAVERVFASWAEMPVFPDVAPALGALRERGWRLAALTNCDEDLFARTRATLPALDAVVTSEAVGSYKPAPGHFSRFASQIEEGERWVHVAESYIADVVPAHRLGIPCIWIDRLRSGNDPSLATARLPDLRALPQMVEAVARAMDLQREAV